MKRRLRVIESCGSTNSALERDAAHGEALMALEQTSGRGQRGNSWEAEAGKNITMSLMLRPQKLAASRQFEVSEAVALGVADLLDALGVAEVAVKWPNDIYVGDRKICGILIENTLSGMEIGCSVAGIGLNVNQREFRSDAPNPVSLVQITGREFDCEELARELIGLILERLERGGNHDDYRRRLWRGRGVWPWVTAQGRRFEAEVEDVLPTGHLVLGGKAYAFKEVFPLRAERE